MNRAKNLWILTEERPKKNVLEMILSYFAKDYNFGFLGNSLQILPLLDENKCFDFTYEVIGFKCNKIDHVYIKTISGKSSFADFLVYYQNERPTVLDQPIYAIEETKTDDKESRNTGVYQRCSKFVYIKNYYPNTKLIMLYALLVEQKENPTDTYIFGTRLLLTLGVDILGKVLNPKIFKPFESIEELIECKNNMSLPHSSQNVPIIINREEHKIYISGRLYKNNSLAHDPNIGALSIIATILRKLGWKESIIITQHGLEQKHIHSRNKFIQIANIVGIELEDLSIPSSTLPDKYWDYDMDGEKLGTIFLHTTVENFTDGYSIFDNHAHCEKSYFRTSEGEYIPLAKYADRDAYKAGDKTQIIAIPDLVLVDIRENEVITIEGKKYKNKLDGIKELSYYDSFDKYYLSKYYPQFKIVRSVVLYGGEENEIVEVEIGFLLNSNGNMILGIRAPKLFRDAINNLLDYWK